MTKPGPHGLRCWGASELPQIDASARTGNDAADVFLQRCIAEALRSELSCGKTSRFDFPYPSSLFVSAKSITIFYFMCQIVHFNSEPLTIGTEKINPLNTKILK